MDSPLVPVLPFSWSEIVAGSQENSELKRFSPLLFSSPPGYEGPPPLFQTDSPPGYEIV